MKIIFFLYLFLEILLFIVFIKCFGGLFVVIITIGTILIGGLILRNLLKSRLNLINKKNYSFTVLEKNSFSDELFLLLIAIFFIVPGFLTDFLAVFLVSKRFRNLLNNMLMNVLLFRFLKTRFNNKQDDTISTTYDEIKD